MQNGRIVISSECNESRNLVAIPFVDIRREAPSIRAASSSSFGIVMKNCRIRNVPYALNIHGITSEAIRSTDPIMTINWYMGMIRTRKGIMIVPR